MSGVALRCSNCGTVQATPGECEACHEASVRYFCTNHAPGLWLDASSCPECGARFGEAAPAPRITERPIAPAPATFPEPLPWPIEPRRTSRDLSDDRTAPRRGMPSNPWLDLLVSATRLRKASSVSPDEMDRPHEAVPMGGCLKRALALVLTLVVLFVLAAMLVGGFLLQLL